MLLLMTAPMSSYAMQFMIRLVEQGVRIADEAGEETISIVYDRYRMIRSIECHVWQSLSTLPSPILIPPSLPFLLIFAVP